MPNRHIQDVETKINEICRPYGVRASIMPGYKGKRPGPEDKDYPEAEYYDYYIIPEGKTPPIKEGTYGYIVTIETDGKFLDPERLRALVAKIFNNIKGIGRIFYDPTPKELIQRKQKFLEEWEHIPKGSPPQEKLREMYWKQRWSTLSEQATNVQAPKELLDKCITHLKKDCPDFEFKYDKEFFYQQGLD